MIGTRIEVTYKDEKRDPDIVLITHYAVGRVAQWARLNGMPSLDPMAEDLTTADRVLVIQLCTWAECTAAEPRAQWDFDRWVAGVADFNPVEVVGLDPTEPAT